MNKIIVSDKELQEKRKMYVSDAVGTIFSDIFAARAENAEIWDHAGRRYLDFAGGIGSLNTGHRNPTVMKYALEQMNRLTHSAFQVVGYESYVRLAEKLCKLAPGSDAKKAVLFSTGAEALENAVKIARYYTKRPGVIAFRGAFHGRTSLTMAMTGKVAPYKKAMRPLPGDVYHIPLPIEHHGISEKDSMKALEYLFASDIEPEQVAAIFIEPVQGEGGFYYPTAKFMQDLMSLAKKHGILFVADEVQSGFARTGKWFAIEHFGVTPDMITVAKSMSGGFPLSAVIGRKEIMDAPHPGALGGTFGGNPVSCAAALGVIEEIESKGLLARSQTIGERMRQQLEKFKKEPYGACIDYIRGLGGMVAFEFFDDQKRPDPDKTKQFSIACKERGLIIISCGINANTIRILVPITIPDNQLEEGLGIMKATLEHLHKN